MITTPNGRQPAEQSDVRVANLAVVLRFVAAHAPCSRADIAAAVGLTKATVSSLVGELIDRQLLRETGLTVRRVGRPATMIELDGAPYASLGLEIGAGRLTAVALDPAGRRLLSWRRAVSGSLGAGSPGAGSARVAPGRTLAAAAALARRAVEHLRADGRQVLGLTVGLPGVVDDACLLRRSAELGWHDVPVRETLHTGLGEPDYPVVVAASAPLAAAAEHRYGGHPDAADLIYLTGTTRVLAGIVTGGAVLSGAGGAGLVGHLPTGPATGPAAGSATGPAAGSATGPAAGSATGPAAGSATGPARACACGCGRTDCLDAVATIAGLAQRVDPTDPLSDLDQSVTDLVRRARAAEPAALDALDDVGWRLGVALALVADLLDPRIVVFGGHYATLAPWLLPPAEAALRARVTAPDGCRLVASTLGHHAAAIGAAAAALGAVDAGRLPVNTHSDRAMSTY